MCYSSEKYCYGHSQYGDCLRVCYKKTFVKVTVFKFSVWAVCSFFLRGCQTKMWSQSEKHNLKSELWLERYMEKNTGSKGT